MKATVFAAAVLAAAALGAWSASAQVVVVPPPIGEISPIPQDPGTEPVTKDRARIFDGLISRTVNSNVARALGRGAGAGEEDTAALPRVRGNALPPGRLRAGREGEGGPLDGRLAAWVTGNVSFLESEIDEAEYDGTIYTPFLGADYVTETGWVFGLALGYERADIDTDFNSGRLESDGFTVTPYVGKAIAGFLILDAGIGYARLDYDRLDRSDDTPRRGSFAGDRFFVFANANAYAPQEWMPVEEVQAIGRVGFSYSHETQEAFRSGPEEFAKGEIRLGQVKIGAELRYSPEISGISALTLLARAEGRIDAIRSDAAPGSPFATGTDDRTDILLGLGAEIAITDRISADLSYERAVLREDLTEQSVVFGLRINF